MFELRYSHILRSLNIHDIKIFQKVLIILLTHNFVII